MKNRELLIIGGDKRCEYMEEYLASQGCKTIVYEKDESKFIEKLSDESAVVILPLPVSRDGGTINITDSTATPFSLEKLIELVKKGDSVFGGMIKDDIQERLSDKGVNVTDYYGEDLILANSKLTAIALEQFVKEKNIALENRKILITGFGRTAKDIAYQFNGQNCDFIITARKDEAITDAISRKYKTVKLNAITDKLPEFDIIINTVPAQIIDEKMLCSLKSGTVIIDIASYPYGVEIPLAEKHGVKVYRALSLPGRYLPQKAGMLIGAKVKSLLQGR